MKSLLKLLYFCAFIMFLYGCSKDDESPNQEITGRWTLSTETLVAGSPPYSPLPGFGLFATSSSDVILHEDQTYTPLERQGSPTIFLPLPKGTYEYKPELKKIFFRSGFELEYTIKYFEDDDLWLEWAARLYKFKRN